LSTFNLTEEREAWCVDYTLEAIGGVGTIEIPGELATSPTTNIGTLVLAPGARPPENDDGDMVQAVAQRADQLFFNHALLPGWQKFLPTFRVGEISTIDYSAHTCAVDLDAVVSSAQSLDINQENALTDVPVEYMQCDSRAFEEGDRVVVQFDAQDWNRPRVVGFESNPRPCANVEFLRYYYKAPGIGAPGGQSDSFIHTRSTEFAEEMQGYYENYITPDPYPGEPGTGVTELAFYVKKAGEAWQELTDFEWRDARTLFPVTGVWWSLTYSKQVVRQQIPVPPSGSDTIVDIYEMTLTRYYVGSGEAAPPEFIETQISASTRYARSSSPQDIQWNYDLNIPGVVEFLIKRTSDNEVLYHVATDMDGLTSLGALVEDTVAYQQPVGDPPTTIPGFEMTWMTGYTLSEPPA